MSPRELVPFCILLLSACAPNDAPKEAGPPVASQRRALLGGQNDLAYVANFEPFAPAYTPITGTALPLVASNAYPIWDDGIAEVPLNSPMDPTFGGLSGFKFELYGRAISTIFVGVNGLVTFDAQPGPDHWGNSSIFTTDIGMAVAPWWDDLRIRSPYQPEDMTFAFCSTCTPRSLTFQWKNLTHIGDTTNTREMQVTLHEATPGHEDSNAIRIHYGDIVDKTSTRDSATVGVKNEEGGWKSTESLDCLSACQESRWNFGRFVYKPPTQVYVRSELTQPYAALSGAAEVTPADRDEGYVELFLPFDFVYYGKVYTRIYVSVNGLITFGDPPPAGAAGKDNVVIPGTAAPNNFIAPWWDDLYLPAVGDPDQGAIYATSRTLFPGGPIHEFIVEWKNLKRVGGDGTRHNMQVHLFTENYIETHQFIEIAYGDISNPATATDNATIGLEDEGGTVNSHQPASDCSPSCSGANWPAGKVHRYTRPTWQHLYNKYFAASGLKTLHCYACHYEFRADPDRFSMAVPSPADEGVTYNLLFNEFFSLDHNNKITGFDPMTGMDTTAPIGNPDRPTCGGTPPRYARTFKMRLFHTFNGHLDPLSDALSPYGPLHWFNPDGNMPFDCTCEAYMENGQPCPPAADLRFDLGRRELLTWWGEGALEN